MLSWPIRGFAFLLLLATVAGTQSSRAAEDKPPPDLPLEQWLREPDRTDVPLKMRILGPLPTYELRQIVRVVAKINTKALQKKHVQRELHYFVKIADEAGNWLPGDSYGSTSLQAKLGGGASMDLVGDAYLEPGNYTVAMIVYDAVLKERSVVRKPVRVPDNQRDRFSEFRQPYPKAEFLHNPERGVVPLGQARAMLPLRTSRPVHIDLVIDFGAYREELRSRTAKFFASRLLQTASVLSQIRPSRGCLEVSAIDILRLELFFRRQKPDDLDWHRVRDHVLKRNLDVVGAGTLASRREAASIFGEFLQELIKAPATCGAPGENPLRIVLLVASGVDFPPKSEVEPIKPECECVIYYLRQEQNPAYPFDELPRLLKRSDARKINFTNPKKFRQQLAELFESLEQVTTVK